MVRRWIEDGEARSAQTTLEVYEGPIPDAMLEKIRAEHPHAEWMITGNAESNGPMLSINHRLGFKEHRAGAVYQVSRERLAEVAV